MGPKIEKFLGWLRKRGKPGPKVSSQPKQAVPRKQPTVKEADTTTALAPRRKRQPDAVDMHAIEMQSKERLRSRFSQLERELVIRKNMFQIRTNSSKIYVQFKLSLIIFYY